MNDGDGVRVIYIAERGPNAPRGWRHKVAQWLRLAAADLDGCFVIGVYGAHAEDRPAMAALVAHQFAWKLTLAAQSDAELDRVVAQHGERT